jgi:hypothetical protein
MSVHLRILWNEGYIGFDPEGDCRQSWIWQTPD